MINAKTQDIPLKTAAAKIRLPAGADIAEIRLRAGRCAAAVTVSGKIIRCSAPFSEKDIADCFAELCRYSVHSYSREIAEGFITLDGGHRVGLCGTAVMSGGAVVSVKDISSLNIRIAREVKGCAEELYGRFFAGGLCSLLLAGRPMSGKTTVLRDLSRMLGESCRVALIDSRNELSASVRGLPTLDVGENTDVLCGYTKSAGIMTALRSLSPDVIICDEIGDDYEAVEHCLFCGVKVIAAAHAGSLSELSRRHGTDRLLPLFDCAAVIGGRGRLLESRAAS
ncbi:MAG: hypothetical protein ACI4XA_10895 [Oscillospiraceae bacterium]